MSVSLTICLDVWWTQWDNHQTLVCSLHGSMRVTEDLKPVGQQAVRRLLISSTSLRIRNQRSHCKINVLQLLRVQVPRAQRTESKCCGTAAGLGLCQQDPSKYAWKTTPRGWTRLLQTSLFFSLVNSCKTSFAFFHFNTKTFPSNAYYTIFSCKPWSTKGKGRPTDWWNIT